MIPPPGTGDFGAALDEALERIASSDLDVRCDGVTRLASLDDERATAALVALLDETSWYLRDRVVEALAVRVGATAPLLAMLGEGAWFARASACQALGQRGDLAAVPALLEQVEDRNVSLQKAAVEALRDLAEAHGVERVAHAIAGLPSGRRRRVQARVGHQLPSWAGELEGALAELPPETFAVTIDRVAPTVPPQKRPRGMSPLVRFRRWLQTLPTFEEGKT